MNQKSNLEPDSIDVEEMTLANIAISRIRPFSGQPRQEFDEEELLGLAQSIEEIGLQNPVSVISIVGDIDHDFELIDGERRLRAHQLLGWRHIQSYIRPHMAKDHQFALSVAANFCRVGHTPMETARALKAIVDGFMKNGVDGEELGREECIERAAKICGRSAGWGSQHLSLLRLCPEVQHFLSRKQLSFQIGIALSGIKEDFQIRLAKHIISSELDHRKALSYIRAERSPEIVSVHGRNRKPSDDYAIIISGVKKAIGELDLLLDISMKKIKEAFGSRSTIDLEKAISNLEDLSNQARLFAENLKSARK
jgi:ParB/RepB/Spo0J family partition protein